MAERKRRYGRRETLNMDEITSGLKLVGFGERSRKESGPYDRLIKWDNVAITDLQELNNTPTFDRPRRDSGSLFERSRKESGSIFDRPRKDSGSVFDLTRRDSNSMFDRSRKNSDSIFNKLMRRDSSTVFDRARKESGSSFFGRMRKESSSFLNRMRKESSSMFGRSRRESAPSFEKSIKDGMQTFDQTGPKKQSKLRKISCIIPKIEHHETKSKDKQKRKYSVPENAKVMPKVYPDSWDEFMVISKGRSSSTSKWSGGDEASDISSASADLLLDTPEPGLIGFPHIEHTRIEHTRIQHSHIDHTQMEPPNLGSQHLGPPQFEELAEVDNDVERCIFQPLYCWCTRCQMMYRMYIESDKKLTTWGNYPCFRF